ncbi:hypothetical protein [Maridesulfovibrio sp.]|uniref:hypothetical protein n=1 Tax=Maridesulfovibrio sp. TaxID=2795000 RepID=UPI0029C9ECE0|nr:hypothetical protein [Maridesulfovibrio sp.]
MQIVIGRFLTPALDTLFNWIASVTEGIVKWAEAYPEAAKWIGYAGLAILGFTGIIGTLTIAAGFGKIAMLGWSSAVTAWTTVTKVAMFFTKGWRSAQMLLNAAFVANPIGVVIAGLPPVSACCWPCYLIFPDYGNHLKILSETHGGESSYRRTRSGYGMAEKFG